MNKRYHILFSLLITFVLGACSPTTQTTAQSQVEAQNAVAEYYVPSRGVERRNYNWRMELSDDPTVILWCTSAFSTPGSPIFTVPIIGKLTSGNKRPWPVSFSTGDYSGFTEKPGPDGMYGSSGEYRYGFGPQGQYEYYDFYGIETFCTTMPTVWQREKTVIVYEKDPALMAASEAAQTALEAGNADLAEDILLDAINAIAGEQ